MGGELQEVDSNKEADNDGVGGDECGADERVGMLAKLGEVGMEAHSEGNILCLGVGGDGQCCKFVKQP